MANEEEEAEAEQQIDASKSETGSVSSSKSIPILITGRDHHNDKFSPPSWGKVQRQPVQTSRGVRLSRGAYRGPGAGPGGRAGRADGARFSAGARPRVDTGRGEGTRLGVGPSGSGSLGRSVDRRAEGAPRGGIPSPTPIVGFPRIPARGFHEPDHISDTVPSRQADPRKQSQDPRGEALNRLLGLEHDLARAIQDAEDRMKTLRDEVGQAPPKLRERTSGRTRAQRVLPDTIPEEPEHSRSPMRRAGRAVAVGVGTPRRLGDALVAVESPGRRDPTLSPSRRLPVQSEQTAIPNWQAVATDGKAGASPNASPKKPGASPNNSPGKPGRGGRWRV